MAHKTTRCLSLVKGRRIRATRLDGCGRPVYAEDSSIVSDGSISVKYTANSSTSDEIKVQNMNGDVIVDVPATTQFTGYGIEIDFATVDPELFSLITGQPVVLDATGEIIIGFDLDTAVQASASGFALELWAGSVSGDACVNEGAQGQFGYLLNPFIQGGIVGDFTVENDAVSFTLTGGNTIDGNSWGAGPYDVMIQSDGTTPGPLTDGGPSSTVALRTILVDVAPPDAQCGSRPLMDPSKPPITAIAVTGTVHGVATTLAFTPANTNPVWVDFGDGTWDYIAEGTSGASHTYAVAGTYIITANANGVVFSKSQVIT